jgi:CelD/BcsL family acetyltransferase involved in cellulose biosynthesis
LGDNLRVRRYESLEDLEGLRPAWESLLAQIPTASVFNTWEWLAPWWRFFGRERKLLMLSFTDSSGLLMGLAPLSLHRRSVAPGLHFRVLELMGDGSNDSDNLDLLVRPGLERAVIGSIINELLLLRTQGFDWELGQFNTMPTGSQAARYLLEILAELKWSFAVRQQECTAVNLPDVWESFLQQISKSERHTLLRKMRRLEQRYQVRCFKSATLEELPTHLEALIRLHQKRWENQGKPGTFALRARRQFYYDMAASLLACGRLELWLLELDAKTVAAEFNFRYGSTAYGLQDGFDPAYYPDSAGTLLRAYVFRHLMDEGVRRFDFLAGAGYHKMRWGAQVGSYTNLEFARPRSIGSAYVWASLAARNTKEWLRATLPAPAWAALRKLNVTLRKTASRLSSTRLDSR